MEDRFRFSSTYLFKLHAVKNTLDRVFDLVLREHAGITLSQFMLLLAVSEHEVVNQRKVAHFLGISPAAVNRQAEIAQKSGLLRIRDTPKGRGQALTLTRKGKMLVGGGIKVIDKHLTQLFEDENRQLSLMDHVDLLLINTKGVIEEQS